jgi:hypothetical protein
LEGFDMTAAARPKRSRTHHGKTVRLRRLTVVQEPPTHYPIGASRPKTRGECADVPRPCPYASCRMNTYLETLPPDCNGDPAIAFSTDVEIWETGTSNCALDAADDGGLSLDEVGVMLSLTRERVRQLVELTFRRLPAEVRAELQRAAMP